jgi:CBS domain-containing protein
MRARDVMTTNVVTVTRDTPAMNAVRLMRQQRIHHLIVRDRSRPLGILSDRDLGGRHPDLVAPGRSVGDLMTSPVVSVDDETTIRRIANMMRGRSIGCVVVTREGEPVGLITISDMLALLGRGAERPIALTERRGIHHRAPHKKRRTRATAW